MSQAVKTNQLSELLQNFNLTTVLNLKKQQHHIRHFIKELIYLEFCHFFQMLYLVLFQVILIAISIHHCIIVCVSLFECFMRSAAEHNPISPHGLIKLSIILTDLYGL